MGAAESSLATTYSLKDLDLKNIGIETGGLFRFAKCQHRSTGEYFSAFIRSGGTVTSTDVEFLQNAISVMKNKLKLKTIRHPGIIKFVTSEVGPLGIIVITELVEPLMSKISDMSPEDICIGIYQIIKTVNFLHSVSLLHNFIHPQSIYVTKDHRWVLGTLEFVTEASGKYISQMESFIPTEIKPPSRIETTPFTRDLYALGVFIKSMTKIVFEKCPSQPSHGAFDWREASALADSLIFADRTISTSWILQQDLFASNLLIQIVDFLNEIVLVPLEKKIQLFSDLASHLRKLPRSSVETYILPKLLKSELLIEPGALAFYTELFSHSIIDTNDGSIPANYYKEDDDLLSTVVYKVHILPFIQLMFKSRQYEVRHLLLSTLNSYVDVVGVLAPGLLESTIISELIVGFDEEDDDIYFGSISGLIKCIYPYCQVLERRVQTTGMLESELITPTRSRRGLTPSGTVVTAAAEDDLGQSNSISSTASSTRPRTKSLSSAAQFSVSGLVENLIVPHCIKICNNDSCVTDLGWIVLTELVTLWKQLCIYLNKSKVYNAAEISRITRSLMKAFHLVLRVLRPEQKIIFLSQKLVGSLDHIGDPNIVVWVPKIMELLIPFLKDDNREVRKETAVLFGRLIAVMSATTDRVSSVVKRRDPSGLSARLKQMYSSLVRSSNSFQRLGPRQMHVALPPDQDNVPSSRNTHAAVSPLISSIPASSSVESKTLMSPLLENEIYIPEPKEGSGSKPVLIPGAGTEPPEPPYVHSSSPDTSLASDISFQGRKDPIFFRKGSKSGSIRRKSSTGSVRSESEFVRTKIKIEEVPIIPLAHNIPDGSKRKPPLGPDKLKSSQNLRMNQTESDTRKFAIRYSIDYDEGFGGWNDDMDEDLELNDIIL